jgi:uncharacterized protein YndB with AHSA1/START domain
MPDILLDLPIAATPAAVFAAVSTPAGLDTWWTLSAAGIPAIGSEYQLLFGPGHQWKARVVRYAPERAFELLITTADADWRGTRVAVTLEDRGERTWLRFAHRGWRRRNEHYRVSCNCWPCYLRILRRSLEFGERVPYQDRLSV